MITIDGQPKRNFNTTTEQTVTVQITDINKIERPPYIEQIGNAIAFAQEENLGSLTRTGADAVRILIDVAKQYAAIMEYPKEGE